jgi:hypothetical protein
LTFDLISKWHPDMSVLIRRIVSKIAVIILFVAASAAPKASAELISRSQVQVAQTRIVMIWVQVTRPMYACESTNDSAELRALFLGSYLHWVDGKGTANGCRVLKLGEVFLLDHEQTEADTKIVVKMWSPVCPRGCVPSMTPVYAPARSIAGDYLRPVPPPRGW